MTDSGEVIAKLSEQESEQLHREGRLWLLQDTANYLQDIMDSIAFPALLPGEREKLEAAREVLFVLRDTERAK